MLCPSCNNPYIRISHLLNPPRLIYVHREVGKRDSETNERKPVEWCMSRSKGKQKGQNILADVDIHPTEDVIYGVDGVVKPSPQSLTTKSNLIDPLLGRQGEENKKMPFKAFDKAKLAEQFPSTFGRGIGKPSVSIAGNGRVQFSVEVSKAFEGCKVLSPAFEGETNRLRLEGLVTAPKGKEGAVWDIVRAKEGSKNKTVSISASTLLKAVNYDYKTAGNQSYEVEKQDNDKHVIIFGLPKETPAAKPKVNRPRKAKTAAAGVNGTPPAPATAPTSAASKATMGIVEKPKEEGDDIVVDE